jgi:hypothetical protein
MCCEAADRDLLFRGHRPAQKDLGTVTAHHKGSRILFEGSPQGISTGDVEGESDGDAIATTGVLRFHDLCRT